MRQLALRGCCLILGCVLLVGCTHRYRYFDFESARVEAAGGVILIWARGSWDERGGFPNTTDRASPYFMVVSFDTGSEEKRTVLLEIKRIFTDSKTILVGKAAGDACGPPSENGTKTTIVAEGLQLPHEPIHIEGTVLNGEHSSPFRGTLNPKYDSEFRSDLWDMLLSV